MRKRVVHLTIDIENCLRSLRRAGAPYENGDFKRGYFHALTCVAEHFGIDLSSEVFWEDIGNNNAWASPRLLLGVGDWEEV